ncbi:unnamed protein product [Withania somnifera]
MKSIICSFLLLTTFCVVPFVAFSSTFTSTNPIVLPTTSNEDNGAPVPVLPELLDIDGEPLHVDQEYHIRSIFWGAGSGAVDFARIGNTRCPNAVVFMFGDSSQGLPVKFFTHGGPVVRETNDINIMFSFPKTIRCNNGTYWMVDFNPDMTARGVRFVVTSTVLFVPNSLFQIVKSSETSPFYKIRHCPGQGVDCEDVGLTSHKGYNRLAITNEPFYFTFTKVSKTDA